MATVPQHPAGAARQSKADKYYQSIMPRLYELNSLGLTQREIAKWLNDEGHLMMDGRPFHQVAVSRLLKKYPQLGPPAAQPGAKLAKVAAAEAKTRPKTLDERLDDALQRIQAESEEADRKLWNLFKN
ncbi:hypothetical protein [Aeoliella mucimassa]|uniref:Recombinase domain-containing protein n=1 Tax=Aeoliella mucimassa TaxID=2527972 RepID=A0A518ALL3_9BACT|nr:hypothetical protein [Aeoliella mucimassa]QDU55617.1 hypothetical protein Pan181_18090 [Aeoliella mucimassa]